MSVAGILGSSLFANAVSQVAQKLAPAANQNTGAQCWWNLAYQSALADRPGS
jgi:hypothetical protein